MRSILPLIAFTEQHTEEFACQGLSKATVDLLFLIIPLLPFLTFSMNSQILPDSQSVVSEAALGSILSNCFL